MALEFSRISTESESVTVAELAREIWTEYYTPIIGESQVRYMLDTIQSESSVRAQMSEGYEYYLVRTEGELAGYFSIQLRDEHMLFLSKIYLLKGQRRKGLGRACLTFIIDRAKALGARTITLTVNKNNIESYTAYEKLGFKRSRALVADIGGSFVMDDWEYELAI